MVNRKKIDSSSSRFTNRSKEEIYHDILNAVDSLQYNTQTEYARTVQARVNFRTRKNSRQFNPIRGALLRNVMDKCGMGSQMFKRYLMDMYTLGLIDLGAYMMNINPDYKHPGGTGKHDRLITVTEKGYKLLRLLNDISEMIKVTKNNGPER